MNATKQPETPLPLVNVSRESMHVLQQHGLTAETIGLDRLGKGSALVTLETAQEIKEDLRTAIRKCDDPEGKAGLANAWANIAKAEAAVIKAVNGMTGPQPEGQKRKGKLFAPAAPIDVNGKA